MQTIGAILLLFVAGHAEIDTTEQNATTHAGVSTQQEVIQYSGVGELPQVLKGTSDADASCLIGSQSQQVASVECYAASNWLIDPREDVKERCFARSIRTDDGK